MFMSLITRLQGVTLFQTNLHVEVPLISRYLHFWVRVPLGQKNTDDGKMKSAPQQEKEVGKALNKFFIIWKTDHMLFSMF